MNTISPLVATCMKKTVGVMLTAFDGEFSGLSLKCLETTVDINLFKQFYVLANCPTDEHVAFLRTYEERYPNLQVIRFEPAGLPMVTQMLNKLLEDHLEDVIFKMDDDLFVTPGCVYGMFETYNETVNDPDVIMVSPLVCNNTATRNLMKKYLQNKYPEKATEAVFEGGVSHNEAYVRFNWDTELADNVMVHFRDTNWKRVYSTQSFLNINCILFDKRAMSRALPFIVSDEYEMNQLRFTHKMHNVIDAKCLAYHYSFGPWQDFMRQNYPLDRIAEHVLAIK